MPKIIRKILIGLIIFILIVFAGIYLAFKVATSPGRLKNSFQQIASSALNRNVSIEDAQLKPGKLVLKNIKVEFRENDKIKKEFKNYIQCDEIKIKFRIWPLFSKKFIFKELFVKKPAINIDHRLNIDLRTIFTHQKTSLFNGKGIYFNIDKVELSGGKVNILLPEFNQIFTKNVEVLIKNRKDNKLKVELKAEFDKSGFEQIRLSGLIDIFKKTAEIEILEIGGYQGKLDIKGKINNILTDPQLNLTYNISKFPAEIMPPGMEISGEPVIKGEIESKMSNLYVNWNSDFSACKIKYKNLYQKSEGETLRFKGGIINKMGSFDINWYVIELLGSSISGTGTINKNESLELNVIGESIDLKQLAKKIKAMKYIAGGQLDIRGKLKKNKDSVEFSGKSVLTELRVKNLKGLSKLYNKITGIKKNTFNMKKVNIDILIDEKKLKINNLNIKGGAIEGHGKGYYKWGEEINFVVYPRIYGKEIGFRIYGSTGNIKLRLK